MQKNIMQMITKNSIKMSKSQKRISKFITENYDQAAFMTAAALGEAADVSESTVVRFAMALGFKGYPDLQRSLQELIRNKLTNLQRINLTANLTDESALYSVLKSDMNNLRATIEEIDPNVFKAAIGCLLSADNIYIVGHRSASMLAQFLGYYLNYVFPNIKIVSAGSQDVADQVLRINDNDTLVAITFPRYSNRTIEAVRIAKANGASVIAVTDTTTSPAAQYADYCLLAKSDMASFADSLVAPLSLINAIIVACGLNRQDEIKNYFEELERIWDIQNVYSKKEDLV